MKKMEVKILVRLSLKTWHGKNKKFQDRDFSLSGAYKTEIDNFTKLKNYAISVVEDRNKW